MSSSRVLNGQIYGEVQNLESLFSKYNLSRQEYIPVSQEFTKQLLKKRLPPEYRGYIDIQQDPPQSVPQPVAATVSQPSSSSMLTQAGYAMLSLGTIAAAIYAYKTMSKSPVEFAKTANVIPTSDSINNLSTLPMSSGKVDILPMTQLSGVGINNIFSPARGGTDTIPPQRFQMTQLPGNAVIQYDASSSLLPFYAGVVNYINSIFNDALEASKKASGAITTGVITGTTLLVGSHMNKNLKDRVHEAVSPFIRRTLFNI